ncbi:PfkB family carbohydrate kinase [Pseudonocardia humida]|uniref:Bifunctional hydroxymethylpyrimidine kinase/phosphomethylpyrimidine kinase n=1 Tax=Pseudonocardia humida TaxID=2800819 RepID=A0ABT1A1V0_9PSEU|nr:PfkB family carbohydrate kinase [Pseudonocardia humida]MCO1656986.1 bifunctional hydroxymethylpyrimidine kinase/phosphomethylpyrimidine kinase [Pseudonocardia humida]
MDVVVVGQLARDLVLRVPRLPDAGSAADVRERREVLGGKGANCAVAVARAGVRVGLLAVAGSDEVADRLLAQAADDGVDTRHVVRRPDTATGLIVEVLEDDGRWRYLQHLPDAVLLTPDDVRPAEPAVAGARAVVLQAQQPGAALLRCARVAATDALVVLDGAPEPDARAALLAAVDVLRADPAEAALLLDEDLATDDVERVRAAAHRLLDTGPSVVALGVEGAGNVVAWADGELFVPFDDTPVVDTTGGGDTLTAVLTVALLDGDDPGRALRRAAEATAGTVSHAGGRPAPHGR